MNDFKLQQFSDRLDAAVVDGTLTSDQVRLVKAALEGGGMQAAMDELRKLSMAKAEPAANPEPEPEPDPGIELAEDLADLRDALNRDLESSEVVDLIHKISAAYAAMEFDADPDAV